MGSALKVRKGDKVYDVLLLKGEQGPKGEDGEVSKDALYNNFGNALKGTATGGAVVVVDDVSPIEHDVAVTMGSKNLLPYPYRHTNRTNLGVTYTDNGDGSITLSTDENGATGISTFLICGSSLSDPMWLPSSFTAGEAYCNSVGVVLPAGVSTSATFYDENLVAKISMGIASGSDHKVATLTSECKRLYYYIRVATGTVIDNLTLYPMIEKGRAATSYTPYIEDFSDVTVKRYGKNLLLFEDYENIANAYTTTYKDGIFTKTIAVDVTTTYLVTSNELESFSRIPILAPATYVFSASQTSSGNSQKNFYAEVELADGTTVTLPNNTPVTLKQTGVVTGLRCNGYTGTLFADTILTTTMQLEVAESATEWEQPIEPVSHSAAADGTLAVPSLYPNMTLISDTDGVNLDCTYNRDINKAVEKLTNAIISTGGNV